jgi:hypothetical protein
MDALVEIDDDLRSHLNAPWGAAGRAVVLGVVSGFSKLALTVLNKFEVNGHDRWLDAVYNRPQGQGLVTIANHTRFVQLMH